MPPARPWRSLPATTRSERPRSSGRDSAEPHHPRAGILVDARRAAHTGPPSLFRRLDRNPPIYTHRYLRYNVLGGLRATYGPRCRGQDQTRGLWRVADFFQTPANWRRPLTTPGPRRISVECPGTLLVALYRHDANTPAQDRSQLVVAELVKGAVVVDRCVDYLDGLAFEAW